MKYADWQKALWRILTNPGIEIALTIALVMVATWYVLQAGPTDPLPVHHFGKR